MEENLSVDFLGPTGWIPPEERTQRQQRAHEDALGDFLIPFQIQGSTDESEELVDLTRVWAHDLVKQALGYAFEGVHQLTGSCVGAGGGNMATTLNFIECLLLHEPEQIILPFWLLPYGRSRYYMGDRGRGEGSLGSTFFKAAKEDGFLDNRLHGLPMPRNDDGLIWGEDTEYSWSDGDAQQTMDLLSKSRERLIGAGADMRTPDDVEQAIRNLYPVTTASSLIPNPRIEDDGEAYGRVSRSGGHQTTFLGVWRHPRKGGRWFKYVNQWGRRWGKNGACWLPESDVVAMIRDGGETYCFSKYNGYPARTFIWDT